MTERAFQFTVCGRVQGVFFRASARKKALELGLKGWVQNLPSGEVEGLAQGDEPNLQAFIEWLQQGPEQAKVSQVDTIEETLSDYLSFEIY